MSGGGGQAVVGKWGRVPDGGIDQIFASWGDRPNFCQLGAPSPIYFVLLPSFSKRKAPIFVPNGAT